MGVLKSSIRATKKWWWLPASSIVTFFLIPLIVWSSRQFMGWSQEYFHVNNFERPLLELGLHGYVLMAIAILGLPFVVWRGIELHKQSKAVLEQSNIAQRNLLNERYQKGVEMLSSKALSARLGGIYALESLAKNDSLTYHIQIMSVLSAFVRNWHIEDERESEQNYGLSNTEKREPPEDVCTILEVVGSRSSEQCEIELQRKYIIDLSNARLRGWWHSARDPAVPLNFSNINFSLAVLSGVSLLPRVNFTKSYFMHADLSGAMFMHADFSNAHFSNANLSKASLAWASLTGVSFECAKLFDTDLSDVKDLTQEQLNSAEIDLQRPPELKGAVDPITGKPLIVLSPQSVL